ncbi:hypothetical protein M011DRAFT_473163 [Sporormia fimetaria CBS 119925]|uniref:Anaphase-promoting complex subunit 2 n=1 Tax=Sporormia fimetaria CBS 119925 TaxID=1340428 RepID=A0A6A6VQJ7_9PLEO|nr:hypothetical protein M011DRAFT_473163 [Sporormia fimetaria CBS 119925]
MDYESLIFQAVFGGFEHTDPTPLATPDPGNAEWSANPFQSVDSEEERAVKRNIAWSTATRFLKSNFPGGSEDAHASEAQREGKGNLRGGHGVSEAPSGITDALQFLLNGKGVSQGDHEESLMQWYTSEMRLNFAKVVQPELDDFWKEMTDIRQSWIMLEETQRILETARTMYLAPFRDHMLPLLDGVAAATAEASIEEHFRIVSAHCLPERDVFSFLCYVFYDAACLKFNIYTRKGPAPASASASESAKCSERLLNLVKGLERVGLAGDRAQVAFAHAVHLVLESFVDSHHMKVDWVEQQAVVPQLTLFVEKAFTPFIKQIMARLDANMNEANIDRTLQMCLDNALKRVGKRRADNLFDYVIHWLQSAGAVADLKASWFDISSGATNIKTKASLKLPDSKQQVIDSFLQQVQRRLLHLGATTTQIVNVYISIIRVFKSLEPKGVLLDRVSRPIRRYLKEREDTARIVISSLLTDPKDIETGQVPAGSELSLEVAQEMAKPMVNPFSHGQGGELDFNDMNWQPAPADAPPDYKKSKYEDVLWYLLTLWDREDFIDELKNILADQLLRSKDKEYQREIRLLELIKVRLGEDKLQSCEVMLRDMLESRRLNPMWVNGRPITPPPEHRARPEGQHTPSPSRSNGPALNTSILSSFFWPDLNNDTFLIPNMIAELQREYERRYRGIKANRKLRWMNALGHGSITLELEDRTETYNNLAPWQISVIVAFQDNFSAPAQSDSNSKGKGKETNDPKRLTKRIVIDLADGLEMDPNLVTSALHFWAQKGVLRPLENAPNTWTIIENRNSLLSTPSQKPKSARKPTQNIQASPAAAGAVRSSADLLKDKKDVYMSFIKGMLTNQGAATVQRIHMMMKMLVQGGFPFGVEEVRELCEELVEKGECVKRAAEAYGIKKD